MITTGEVGFPGFEAAQMCWMPFLQWPLRRQFVSAVLAEAVRHSASWAEPMVFCKRHKIQGLGPGSRRFRGLACRLLVVHSSFESRWHQAFLASGCRSSVRAGLPIKVHV